MSTRSSVDRGRSSSLTTLYTNNDTISDTGDIAAITASAEH